MNDGICDFRFAICDLVARGRDSRCSHNGRQFASFPVQSGNAGFRQQASVDHQLHPVGRFIGFFFDSSKFRNEFSFRATAAGSSVVRSDGSAATHQLSADSASFGVSRQCAYELDDTQGELLGSSLQFGLVHRSSHSPGAIANP
jgi:hypothetical protein